MQDNSYYYKRLDIDKYQEAIWEEEDLTTFVELEEGEIRIIENALRELVKISLVADEYEIKTSRPVFKIDFAYGRQRYMDKLDTFMAMTHTFEKKGELKKEFSRLKSRRLDVAVDTDFLIEFYFMLEFARYHPRIYPYYELNVFKKQDDYFYFELKAYKIKTTSLSQFEMVWEKFITYRCDGIWGLKKFLEELAKDVLERQQSIIDFFEP